MNKTKIVILKVKKTERTIYDFNILKLDLIQENDSDKLISDYIDTFINEFVEIVDIEYETFGDLLNNIFENSDCSKDLYIENRRCFEDYNYCYNCLYLKNKNDEKKIKNYLACIITGDEEIYDTCIILKQDIEKKTIDNITRENIHEILKNKIMPTGIILNTDYKIVYKNLFFVSEFYNYNLGALSFVNREKYNNCYIDLTCGKLRIAYDYETENNRKNAFEFIAKNQNENDSKFYDYLIKFLSYVIPEEVNKIKNCVIVYYYSINGDDVLYNVSISELCKIIEVNYDNIKKGIFQLINCTNDKRLLDFNIFKKIKSITNI